MKRNFGRYGSLNTSRLVLLLTTSVILSACAHVSKKPDSTQGLSSAEENALIKDAKGPTNDLSDSGTDLEAIPLEVNKMVLKWIDYFQGRGRPHMERYLSRSSRYSPIMKEILRKEGLPEDLIYIALIESGFSSTAHSHASAVGYWQFIRGTGRRYGLKINSYVDERRDFVKSTEAAAQYFKGLYNLFGAWYLAIASYNVGENRVKGLVMKYHTRDFWQLARENKLPSETINYVPKFLAARLIAKEPEKYGFTDIQYMPGLEFDEVELEGSVDLRELAKGMNLEYDDLRDLNPAFKRGVAFGTDGKLALRIPKGTKELALAAAPAASAQSNKMYVADEDYGYYNVQRGDTISGLAKKFGTSQSNLMRMNRFSRSTQLIAGRRIRVPAERLSNSYRERETASKKSNNVSRKVTRGDRKVHVVRRGDTLIEIARKYRVSLRELANHNGLRSKSKIMVGAKLEIP